MAQTVPDLHDDVITLRPPTEGDIDAITAELQEPDISRYTRIPSPYTRDHAVEFVQRSTEWWRTGRDHEAAAGEAQGGFSFMIIDRSNDALLGGVGVHVRDEPEVAEIGYWVAAGARRRGIATRAATLASRWALAELGLVRLELMTRPDNVASQRVAEAAGFSREGVLRSYATVGCGLSDVVMFSLLPSDV